MPKLLVLFEAHADDIVRLADAVAEGARRVRFAEVDVRVVAGAEPSARTSHKHFEGADGLAAYDGIILGVRGGASELASDALAATASLVNRVGSVFTSAPDAERRAVLWAALAPMAEREMILVPPPSFGAATDDQLESARALGKRVAEVVGWVTHARSHHHHH